MRDSPLETGECEQTGSDTSDDPVVPALVPVLVGEESDGTKHGDIDCASARLCRTVLTDTSKTTGDGGTEDHLLGLEVQMRALLLGALRLGLSLGSLEVRLGGVAEN